MIERVEMALITWGDQYRRRGTVAMLQCTLGAMIDAKGEMIRSTAPGGSSVCELASGDMGALGEAVEKALVRIRQPVEAGGHGKVGVELAKLARVRYLTDPMPLVEQQTRRMGWRSQATYRSKLHQLHVLVEPILLAELPWLRRVA